MTARRTRWWMGEVACDVSSYPARTGSMASRAELSTVIVAGIAENGESWVMANAVEGQFDDALSDDDEGQQPPLKIVSIDSSTKVQRMYCTPANTDIRTRACVRHIPHR